MKLLVARCGCVRDICESWTPSPFEGLPSCPEFAKGAGHVFASIDINLWEFVAARYQTCWGLRESHLPSAFERLFWRPEIVSGAGYENSYKWTYFDDAMKGVPNSTKCIRMGLFPKQRFNEKKKHSEELAQFLALHRLRKNAERNTLII